MALAAESAPQTMHPLPGANAIELHAHMQKLQQFTAEWLEQQDILLRSLGEIRTSELSRHSFSKSTPPIDPNSIQLHGLSGSASVNDTAIQVDEETTHSDQEVSLNSHGDLSMHENRNSHFERGTSPQSSLTDKDDQAAFFAERYSNLESLNLPKHVQNIFKKSYAQFLVMFVIIANTIVIAVESDISMTNPHGDPPAALQHCETSFLVFYTIEVGMRIGRKRCDYFTDVDESWWNVFDLALVLQGIVGKVISLIQSEAEGASSNLSFLRLFRVMKIMKVLRVVRLLSFFRELRLILSSIVGCVTSLWWTLVLVVAVNILFGLVFLQACTDYLRDTGNVDEDVEKAIGIWWSSVTTSMLSLFMSTMGGQSWQIIAEPLKHVSGFMYSMFILYIAIFMFVVLNVVSSIFFEAMLYHADKDEQLAMFNRLERESDYVSKLEKLFKELDCSHDGQITYAEFCSYLASPKLHKFLTMLDTDIITARHIFSALSDRGSHPISLASFLTGCIRLNGSAKIVDIIDLHHHIKRLQKQDFEQYMKLHKEKIYHHCRQNAADDVTHMALHDLKELLQETKHLIARTAGGAVDSPLKTMQFSL